MPRVMLGRGSNLIIPDEGYSGLVLRLRGEFWNEISSRSDDSFVVGAGSRLNDICKIACKRELAGFEFLEGIPGTLISIEMNLGLRWDGRFMIWLNGFIPFARWYD